MELLHISGMTRLMEQAVAKAAQLPEADQDEIGQALLRHIDKLSALRAALDEGLAELDAGKGQTLSVEDVIGRGRLRNAGR
ncbi:MAG TPA: hypothetical protein VFB16_02980 [Bauldia sp.]|nr:hypothetical protein [Bauldia sp.]